MAYGSYHEYCGFEALLGDIGFRKCVELLKSMPDPTHQLEMLADLQDKMDSAWVSYALESRLNMNDTSVESPDYIARRHRKLDTLMDELAIEVGLNREVLASRRGDRGSVANRIRRSLIASINSKLDGVRDDLQERMETSDRKSAEKFEQEIEKQFKKADESDALDRVQIHMNGTGEDEDVVISWRIKSPPAIILLHVLIMTSIMTFIFFIFFKLCCIIDCLVVGGNTIYRFMHNVSE
ncbi:Hypothetical protein NTJ_05573 [Nesidiocoris tenuis]|uniref:Uncharacterized protein n=1 Tax=Nesidiocoris tenuis TaxID=355587 RepID=A0ABN7AN84_9HEMI|nr:Hypothetical protein NTJ_05573 [Nesidiocoris tenuis]